MADKQASLIITLQDLASTGLGKLTGAFEKFKVGVMAAYSNFKPFIDFMVSSVKAYFESESAVNRLNNALLNQGINAKEVSIDLQNYAKELQKTTTFSDEAIMETETLLTSFGVFGQELKDTTKAALDLSKGLGIDLHSATMILGKAAQGNTDMLGRYGIKISDAIPPAQKLTAVVEQINERFGGRAQSELNTYAGKIENMKNRLDELKERIGKFLLPVLDFWLDKLDKVGKAIDKITGAEEKEVTATEAHLQAMVNARAKLLEKAQEDGSWLDADVQKKIAIYDAEILRIQGLVNEETIASEAKIAQANKEAAARSARTAKFKADEIAANKARLADVEKLEVQHNAHVEAYEKWRVEQAQLREAAIKDTLSRVAQFQGAKNKEIAAIGKAAAISLAIIDTRAAAVAAMKAMAGIPVVGPSLGLAMAAVITAAGMANVAQIMGVQLAEGGVVLPTSGGTLATVAEAGRPEAVIPLGDNRTKDMMAEAGFGGSSLTFNIGVLVGSENSVRELAIMIDKELFSLRRNNESISLGAL